jgi:hypothetical protein
MSSAAFSRLLKESLEATPPDRVPPTAPTYNQHHPCPDNNEKRNQSALSAAVESAARTSGDRGKGIVPALSATPRVAMTALIGIRVERMN